MGAFESARLVEASLLQRVKGQRQAIRFLLATLFAGGHALLEDLPGTGKTTLAKALAGSVGARFSRVQFTPDLMPSDITGTTVFNPRAQSFDFHPGPIFCNLLLADEINRASPRAQSALLEAMEERQVSAEGASRPLPHPFFVIATENPADMHGTYPLPEAQLDRFMTKLSLGYVSEEDEVDILLGKLDGGIDAPIEAHLSLEQLQDAQAQCRAVHISPALARYIAQITRHTRSHADVSMGASARGSIALMRLSQALAFLAGRSHALPSDVQTAAGPCLAHRIVLRDSTHYQDGKTGESIVKDALGAIHAPV